MSERRPLISGNWKMNLNHFEALRLVQELSYEISRDDVDAVDISVHPPFTDIRTVQTTLETDRIPFFLGAQNCHQDTSGAFTGEVSASMLAKLNVAYVIVGHSERRELFGETDEIVNAKVKAVLAGGMTPILCVGETEAERDGGAADEKVGTQVAAGLDGVSSEDVASMVIAYEPIWAIGTGRTASADDAGAMCAFVREQVRGVAGDAADGTRVLYGGSVNPGNIAGLMAKRDIDGALVGGASLDPDTFASVIRYWV